MILQYTDNMPSNIKFSHNKKKLEKNPILNTSVENQSSFAAFSRSCSQILSRATSSKTL